MASRLGDLVRVGGAVLFAALILVTGARPAYSAAEHSDPAEASNSESTNAAETVREEDTRIVLPSKAKRVKYVPPKGFAEYTWGKRLDELERIKPSPLLLQVAYSEGRTTMVDFLCTATASSDCDLGQALNTLRQKRAGEGFHLFAEFVVPNQGFRYAATGVVMYPVTYQFCAQWRSQTSKSPDDILARMTLCGIRMVFKSQTREELNSMDDEQLTSYELILEELIREYGKPAGYRKNERIVIETAEGKIADPRARRFKTWRWCPPRGRDFVPNCESSIVFGFSPESGNGVVLYATPAVWEFAYAREQSVPGSDPLYKFLHAR